MKYSVIFYSEPKLAAVKYLLFWLKPLVPSSIINHQILVPDFKHFVKLVRSLWELGKQILYSFNIKWWEATPLFTLVIKLLRIDNLGSLRFILQIFTTEGTSHQHIYIGSCTSSVYALLKYFSFLKWGYYLLNIVLMYSNIKDMAHNGWVKWALYFMHKKHEWMFKELWMVWNSLVKDVNNMQ